MNKTSRKSAFILSLVFILNAPLIYAQQSSTNLLGQINTITTAVPFLMISPDARAGGMGDLGVASAPDANSIHWNPAKLAFVEKNIGFSVSYTPWLKALVNDIYLAYLAGYAKTKNGDQVIGGSLRYFSLGNITFTDNIGNTIRDFKPNEFALDAAYSRKLSESFSGGIALRFIHSNLTGGTQVEGTDSKAGNTVAADVSAYYQTDITVGDKDAVFSSGINISNIGAKISYTETGTKNFIPTNLRIGPGIKLKLNEFNELAFNLDINKLLIPTPPIYTQDSTNNTEDLILFGKDPDVSVAQGIFQSFNDAPDGFKEELKEFVISVGMEYWYDQQFAFRAGYFNENKLKGNRKYFTLGAGLRYNVFGIDLAYLIPTEQRNPLENTLHFTLTFDFDAFSDQSKDTNQE